MKTPILIVRLVGLYLIFSRAMTLAQIHQAYSLAGSDSFGVQQESVVLNMQIYSILGLLVGIVATLFSGSVARLLTFNSKPKEDDLSQRLPRSENEKPNQALQPTAPSNRGRSQTLA